MYLTPREKDKLLISMAAIVARGRLERGIKLNHPEAIAIISDYVLEGAREGKTVAELCETLTIEEMIGWAAYAEIEHEEYKKLEEQAQRNSAIKGRRR